MHDAMLDLDALHIWCFGKRKRAPRTGPFDIAKFGHEPYGPSLRG